MDVRCEDVRGCPIVGRAAVGGSIEPTHVLGFLAGEGERRGGERHDREYDRFSSNGSSHGGGSIAEVPMPQLYPSIPHLPGSRTASDRTIAPAEAARCTGLAKSGDVVIVEEKLDGSCVAVRRAGDALEMLGREGRPAAESPNEGRQMFARWAEANADRFREALGDGETLVGEWLALVHGIRYTLPHEPFVVLDLFSDKARALRSVTRERAKRAAFAMPGLVHEGGPVAIADAALKLGRGFSGAIDPPEGLVYRVECAGACALVAKWVRHDKVDGALLPEHTGAPALWNWRP